MPVLPLYDYHFFLALNADGLGRGATEAITSESPLFAGKEERILISCLKTSFSRGANLDSFLMDHLKNERVFGRILIERSRGSLKIYKTASFPYFFCHWEIRSIVSTKWHIKIPTLSIFSRRINTMNQIKFYNYESCLKQMFHSNSF